MSWIVSGLIDKFGGKSDMVGKRIKFGGWVKSVELLTRVGKKVVHQDQREPEETDARE